MMFASRTLGIVVSVGVLCGASSVSAAVCAAQYSTLVEVRLIDPAPKVVTTSSLHQINSKAKAHGLLKRNNLVLGLTQSEVETSLNIGFRGYPQGDRTFLTVDRVDVSFGPSVLDIPVSKEYALGSCQYTTVLKHEMQNVRVNREGVRKYAKILKRDLAKAMTGFSPRVVRTMQSGQAEAQRVLQKVVNKLTTQFHKEIDAQHALIDKPGGAYDASGACGNW